MCLVFPIAVVVFERDTHVHLIKADPQVEMAVIAIISSDHPGNYANEIARRHQWRPA
jgi:hypothetical protein